MCIYSLAGIAVCTGDMRVPIASSHNFHFALSNILFVQNDKLLYPPLALMTTSEYLQPGGVEFMGNSAGCSRAIWERFFLDICVVMPVRASFGVLGVQARSAFG